MPAPAKLSAFERARNLTLAKMQLPEDQFKFLEERIEEHIGMIENWPIWAAEMLLSKHLNYSERYQLTLFMLGNKCLPGTYAEWLLMRHMLHDESARDSTGSAAIGSLDPDATDIAEPGGGCCGWGGLGRLLGRRHL